MGKPRWGEGLQGPLGNPPEQLASLWGRHGVAALQQVRDDQGPLGAGRLDPHATVDPHQQLTGNQLPQVGADLALRRQEPAGGGASTSVQVSMGLVLTCTSGVVPSDQTQGNGEEQTTFSKHSHPIRSS